MAGYHRHTYYSDYCHRPSWVYRLYDSVGSLLYVGISTDPQTRITTHSRKPWGRQIDHYTTERFPDRESAKAEERWAIHHEHPAHNLVRPRMECC